MTPDIESSEKISYLTNEELWLKNSEIYDDLRDEPKKDLYKNYKLELDWARILLFGYFHLASLYGAYLLFTSAKWQTILFGYILSRVTAISMSAGAHRLWSHRAYKATWQLKLFYMIGSSIAFQNSLWIWIRNHRAHHKFNETDADPHNPARSLFFSHLGWLLCKKHPLATEKNRTIDYSDISSDPFVAFQRKHYAILVFLFHFVFCTVVPVYFWNESWINAHFVAVILRWVIVTNLTLTANSLAHHYGTKPYDRHSNPVESLLVAALTGGEGYHNYHHAFPWDYKCSESANPWFNDSMRFINLMAKIGWAYDLKTVSQDMIKRRVLRTGDGTHETYGATGKDQLENKIE